MKLLRKIYRKYYINGYCKTYLFGVLIDVYKVKDKHKNKTKAGVKHVRNKIKL